MPLLLVLSLVVMMFAGCGSADQSGSASAGQNGSTQTQVAEDTPAEGTSDEDEDSQTAKGETAEAAEETVAAEEGETADTGAVESLEPVEDIFELDEDGWYSSKEEVALYIHTFGHLPENYITKNEARDLGWDNKKGNLDEVAPGMSIGGDKFGNYEGLLPDAKGRKYYECDIDYEGGYRGAKRIIFSNDGLIYYTEDHYSSFELLYGEED